MNMVCNDVNLKYSRSTISTLVTSRRRKMVVLCELICPWEENAEWAHESKLEKYE